MNWYTQLKPASFRGVPFKVDGSDRSEGLNTVLREYQFQDLPTIFSMGQAAGEVKLSAYVIGNNHISLKDALEKALLVQESGVLVHPTMGSLRVWHHGKFTVKEAFATEGGMARFDLTFIRAEARRYPTEAANTGLSAFAAAVNAAVAAVQAFVGRYNLDGVAGLVRTKIYNNLVMLHSAVFEVLYALKSGTDGFNDLVTMGRNAEQIIKDMLLMPQDLASHYAGLFGLDKNYSPEQAAAAVSMLLPVSMAAMADAPVAWLPNALPMRDSQLPDLLNYIAKPAASPYRTASREVEAECCAALTSLCQRLAYCALVQAAAQMTYTNYDVICTVRRAVYEHGQRLLMAASLEPSALTVSADMSIHDALMQAYTAALNHLQHESIDLARLIDFTPAAEDNIWSISHQLYGTPDYADEVWSMNRHITNPLLVPAGQPLRVVAR